MFQEIELSSSHTKKFLMFSQNKAFLYWEMELSYILGYGNPEKIPYISGNETFFIF